MISACNSSGECCLAVNDVDLDFAVHGVWRCLEKCIKSE